MAFAQTQQQLSTGYRARCVSLLNRCSKTLARRKESQRCHAREGHNQLSQNVPVAEEQKSQQQTSASRVQQLAGRGGTPKAPSPTAAELTTRIRDCSSPAQLLDLYRLHGTNFKSFHAHIALNRLVDVATPPSAGEGDDKGPSTAAEHDTLWAAQEQARHQTTQLTGRLRVHQGQDFAQPPLHSGPEDVAAQQLPGESADPDLERRGTNSQASTSEPSSADERSSLPRSHRAKQRKPTQMPAPDSDTQSIPGQPTTAATVAAGGDGGDAHVLLQAAAPVPQKKKKKGQQPPPRQKVLAMVSGLARILSHSCHELDGPAVAATARALSRLRYQDVSLLRRLEQRTLKLLKEPPGKRRDPDGAARAAGLDTLPSSSNTDTVAASVATASGAAASAVEPQAPLQPPQPQTSQLQRRRGQKQQRQRRRPEADKARRSTSLSSGGSGGMDADDLSALVHAFSALAHRPSSAWLAAVVQATDPHLPAYAASRRGRLPLLISNLGSLGAAPPAGWLRAAAAAAQPRLAACPPEQLRALAAGLAAMKHSPGEAWMGEYLAASEQRLPEYSPWELVSTVASLAALRCTPGDSWMARFYECSAALVGTPGGLTGRMAAVLLSSLSQLRCKPAGDWLTRLLLGTRRSLGEATSEELTDVLAALARLRFRPPEPWLQQYFAASFQRLPFQTPEQCCATAVALSLLGRRPQPLWLEELGRYVCSKLALMPAGQQTSAVAALVELGYEPSLAWLEAYEKQSNARLAENTPEELCRALSALATVGFKPQGSWLYAFIMATYSKLDSFDATQLALVFDRLPALTPHGSWLDAIIQICAAEAAAKASQQVNLQQQQQQQQQEVGLELQAAAAAVQQQQQQQQPAAQMQAAAGQQTESPPPAEAGLLAATASATLGGAVPAALAPRPAEMPGAGALESQSPALGPAAENAVLEPVTAAPAAASSTSTTDLIVPADAVTVVAASIAPGDGRPIWVAEASTVGAVPASAGAAGVGPDVAVAADRLSIPSLNGMIPISSELVPTVGGLVSIETAPGAGLDPRGPRMTGSAAGLEEAPELGAAVVVGADAAASMQRVPLAERLVVESGAMVAVALTASTAAALGDGSSSSGSSDGSEGVSGGSVGEASNSAVSSSGATEGGRSRRRGNGRGGGDGGGDGGAPGGRGGDGGWADLFPDVGGSGAGSGTGASRPPDVGLLQRPRVARAPAGPVLVAAATAIPAAAAEGGMPIARGAATPAAVVVAQQIKTGAVDGMSEEGWRGTDLALQQLASADGATSAATPAVAVTLQPKPKPPSAPGVNAVGQAATATAGAAATTQAVDSAAAAAMSVGGAVAVNGCGSKASSPVQPFGAAPDRAAHRTPGSDAAAQSAAAAPSSACASAATTAAAGIAGPVADGCVQYLDSESLSRLIGPPDGPPGPDFSGCQKRAKAARGARGAGGGGPFQLGRIWNTDGGAGGGGPMAGPVPSPSG